MQKESPPSEIGEIPKYIMMRHHRNWMNACRRMNPVDRTWTHPCYECGTEGILGYAITFRGGYAPADLLCDRCSNERMESGYYDEEHYAKINRRLINMFGLTLDELERKTVGSGDKQSNGTGRLTIRKRPKI